MEPASLPTDAERRPIVFIRDGEAFSNSRHVAAYFNKRHDDVLKAIRNLIANEADLGVRNFAETPYVDPQNGQTYKSYDMDRDGFSILAMGFTGAKALKWKMSYIAAFNVMEAELRSRPAVSIDFSDPKVLLGVVTHLQGTIDSQQKQIDVLEPKASALDRIATAEGSLCVTDAAKALQMRPKDLFMYLRQHGWIYRRAGASHDLGYQSKVVAGLMEHKVTTVLRADGSEKVTEQVRITPKGLAALSQLIPPPMSDALAA